MPRIGPSQPVEDTARGLLAHLINQIIEDEELPLEGADQQWPIPFNGSQKYADLVIWEEKHSRAACIIEYKPPFWSALDMMLIGDAESKAFKISPQAPYFATWNTNDLALFQTFDVKARNVVERRRGQYRIATVRTLKELWRPEVQLAIKERLRNFLRDLADMLEGRAELPSLRPDNFFIHAIRSAMEAMYYPVAKETKERYGKDRSFASKLNKWFVEQGWSIPTTDEDFGKAARQFAYLLGDKILFYHALRRAGFSLPDLLLPNTLKDGEELKNTLQEFFEKATEVTQDYEPVFAVNFVDHLPLPKSIVPSIVSFVNSFRSYDLSKLEYGDIGRIFDTLIPEHERHLLGQYFTPDRVVDLINAFCIRKAKDKVADFGCGVGTFLVRAYGLKRFLGDRRGHSEIIKDLYGVDISKFPAHLATINLVIRDLASDENYPRIFTKDFFDLSPEMKVKWGWEPVGERITTLDLIEKEVELRSVDAVVGNPPYTRQEEIEKVLGEGYKKKLDKKVREGWKEKVKMGKRAGIHAYFFLHGMSFLKEGGRFGYVVSNSWLDVDYGRFLQEFFLKHSKILAVIEPKLERWFAEADVNTCIVILERCFGPVGERKRDRDRREKKKRERDENIVRFVQLKKPLVEFLGPDDDKRFERAKDLVEQTLGIDELYEDDVMRVFPKKQVELWDEGYDSERKKYIGSKWGKYIRAPEIFFKILEKGKDVLVPLKEVASVRRGYTTGANKFFYLTEEEIQKWGIEKEFWMHKENGKWVPNYVIKSPRESKSLRIDPSSLNLRVLLIDGPLKEYRGKRILDYIRRGEERGFNERRTCATRRHWYSLSPAVNGEVLFPMIHDIRHVVFWNPERVFVDHNLFEVTPKVGSPELLVGILNSYLTAFMKEIVVGRSMLGQGALKTEGIDIEKILLPHPRRLLDNHLHTVNRIEEIVDELSMRTVPSIFEGLGGNHPSEIALDRVDPLRLELDLLILKTMGMGEEDLLKLYRSLVDALRARRDRAETYSRGKPGQLPDLSSIAAGVIRELDPSLLRPFPEEYLPSEVEIEEREVLAGGLWQVKSNLKGIYVEMAGERVYCKTKEEAEYIRYAALYGARRVPIPKNIDILRSMLDEYKGVYNQLRSRIAELVDLYGPDPSQRMDLRMIVWRRLSNRKRTR